MSDTMPDPKQVNKLKAALKPGADCPPLEELAFALETGEEDERCTAARAHLAACTSCRDELALFREFSGTELRSDEKQPVRWIVRRLEKQQPGVRPQRAFSWLLGFRPLAAAACALLIAGGLYLRREAGAPTLTTRGESVMRSSAVEIVAPQGEITQPPAEFRWTAVAGTARYRLRLMEVDRSEIWRAESTQNFIPTASEKLALMKPGKTLLWDVAALDISGKVLATSPVTTFRVR